MEGKKAEKGWRNINFEKPKHNGVVVVWLDGRPYKARCVHNGAKCEFRTARGTIFPPWVGPWWTYAPESEASI